MALNYATLPGDIDHLIADDHAVVERQFQHLEAARGYRRILVDQIAFELALHADAEERVLYPALAKAGFKEDSDLARREHQTAKDLLVTLANTDPGEGAFEDSLIKLMAAIRGHVAEEESRILPEFRDTVDPQELRELGAQFLRAKRTAPTFAHPSAPSTGIGHKLADPAAAAIDKVRERTSGRRPTLATDPSGLLDPQAQAMLDGFSSLNPLPLETLTPDEARAQPGPDDAVRKALEDSGMPTDPEPVGSVEEMTLATEGGGLTLRIYTPAGPSDARRPVVLWIHGGGWVLFDLDAYDASCRGLCNKAGAIVVSPDYRRAPEHVFPAAHDDVLATARWLAQHAEDIGGDPAKIVIGGESVGATMAAATCLQLAEARERLPRAQILVYPLTTADQYGESMADAADARPLNRPLLSWMGMHAFAGKPDAAHDRRVALLDVPISDLVGLPPTVLITAERDVLRSQGQEFARHLDEAGVQIEALHYEGVTHDFFGAAALLDKAKDAQQRVADAIVEAIG